MNNTIAASPWLALRRPAPAARVRLFCFPHAGGGATFYRTWQDALPATVEVCPVQPPGRETRLREPGLPRAVALAAAAADGLRPWLDRPFALFGHSMGAVVAFELARELRRRGARHLVHLFVSGRRAPQLPERRGPLYTLSDEQLLAELTHFNGTPPEAFQYPELIQLLLPIFRTDCEVCDTHVLTPEEPFAFGLTAYGGLSDPDATREELEGWREHTSGTFSVRQFPGDHFYHQANRDLVLAALARDLERIVDQLAVSA